MNYVASISTDSRFYGNLNWSKLVYRKATSEDLSTLDCGQLEPSHAELS